MECKSCGSPLTLEQAYCPFCGAKNEVAAKHIEDMKRYDSEFAQTKTTVLKQSKWYSRYLAVMLAIVFVAIVNVVVIILEYDSYVLQNWKHRIYHSLHEEEVMEMLFEWEEAGEIAKIELYYDVTSFIGLDEANQFMPLIMAYDNMERLKAALIQLSMESMAAKQRNYDDGEGYQIEAAAGAIVQMYEIFSGQYYKWNDNAYDDRHMEHIMAMEASVKPWLKAYLYFTDEDIEKLPAMQKYEVVSLIDRRISENE